MKINYERELQYINSLPLFNDADTAIDVGGNVGIYTYYLLKIFKIVYVFEPNPNLFVQLNRTFCKEINQKRLIIIDAALSNEEKEGTLAVPSNGLEEIHGLGSLYSKKFINDGYTNLNKYQIKIKILDKYNFERIGLIKIDVEGNELNTLNGSIDTIKNNKPLVIIETENRHRKGAVKKVFNFFDNLEYTGYYLLNNQLTTLYQFDIDLNDNSYDKNTKNHYINNFIFIPKNKFPELHIRFNYN